MHLLSLTEKSVNDDYFESNNNDTDDEDASYTDSPEKVQSAESKNFNTQSHIEDNNNTSKTMPPSEYYEKQKGGPLSELQKLGPGKPVQ